jgi:pimeloyl-ACP methyl ester carboxylesterase
MLKGFLRLIFRLYALNLLAQSATFLWHLSRVDVQRTLTTATNQTPAGLQFEQFRQTANYSLHHVIEDGIERVSVTPANRRYETPIVFQHGMWHGAWCWEQWQILLAEWGWESHAHSLPGHAGSFPQRPLWRCTLDYYLAFLQREIYRHETRPVLIGHSMGGALTQWYLKHVGDDLPAAVLVASWVAGSALLDGGPLIFTQDPIGGFASTLTWNATPWVRNPVQAARKLITPTATIKPQELWAKLDGESVMVTFQHNPPFWQPPRNLQTPLLWLAGERDAVVSLAGQRRSAAFYDADLIVIDGEAHNLMMEASQEQTARRIHDWLTAQGVS